MPTNTETIISTTLIQATRTRTISSNTYIGTDASQLLPKCSQSFLAKLYVTVCHQQLTPTESGGTVYDVGVENLLTFPPPVVHKIDPVTGVETLLYVDVDYTINHSAGEITLLVATSDIIQIDYSYIPFTDAQYNTIFELAIQEVAVLIHRTIDEDNIPVEYEAAICLQFAINVLKALIIETRNFFSVSVAGKTVNKTDIPKTILTIIELYQENLMLLIKQLRDWNNTARLD